MLGRLERNVGRGILGRLVVCTGIHAEHREVAGMARPHPVVRFTAELSHGCRRSTYETYVPIYLGHNEILHIVVEEADNADLASGVLLLSLLQQFLALFLVLVAAGDVCHRLEE